MTALPVEAVRAEALPFVAHFGFSENPFVVTPDPRYTYLTPSTTEALEHGRYLIDGRLGFGAITGEIGTGKTTLAGFIVDQAQRAGHAVALLETVPGGGKQTENKIFGAIAADLEIPARERRTAEQSKASIRALAVKKRDEGRTLLVVIDEAHRLRPVGMDAVKALLGMQDLNAHFVQVLAFGQLPEMAAVLTADKALHSRLTIHTRLNPLTRTDVREMVEHRCETAGRRRSPFTQDAVEALYVVAKGIPRTVCTLAENACILACSEGADRVDAPHVKAAAERLLHAEE